MDPTIGPVPEADAQQMILYQSSVTTGGQPVIRRHLGPAELHSDKCNRIRGRPPLRWGRAVSPGRLLSQGDPPNQAPQFQTAGRLKVTSTCLKINVFLSQLIMTQPAREAAA